MQDTLPAAFAQVPMECIFHCTRWIRSLPVEYQGGAGLLLNHIVGMRDPNIAKLVTEQAEKTAKRGKNGRD